MGRVNATGLLQCLHQPPTDERPQPWELPVLAGEPSVVIIGAGPAWLLCALALARASVCSRVLERGAAVS